MYFFKDQEDARYQTAKILSERKNTGIRRRQRHSDRVGTKRMKVRLPYQSEKRKHNQIQYPITGFTGSQAQGAVNGQNICQYDKV